MPIYEYECSRCGHRLEALQKISDAPLQECPACHERALTKLISAASFRLKGGGWYETDFKKDGRRQLAESDAGEGGDKTGKDKTGKEKTESGVADKADGKSGDKAGTAEKKADKPAAEKTAGSPAGPANTGKSGDSGTKAG